MWIFVFLLHMCSGWLCSHVVCVSVCLSVNFHISIVDLPILTRWRHVMAVCNVWFPLFKVRLPQYWRLKFMILKFQSYPIGCSRTCHSKSIHYPQFVGMSGEIIGQCSILAFLSLDIYLPFCFRISIKCLGFFLSVCSIKQTQQSDAVSFSSGFIQGCELMPVFKIYQSSVLCSMAQIQSTLAFFKSSRNILYTSSIIKLWSTLNPNFLLQASDKDFSNK